MPSLPDVKVIRLAGSSRFVTAVEVSRNRFPDGADVVYLAAAGTDDAGIGSGFGDGPVMLVWPKSLQLPAAVEDEIRRLHPQTIVVLGGEASVTQDVVDAAVDAAVDK